MELPKIGAWVVYTDEVGAKQQGRIKSFNHKFIFVVFHCDNDWDNFIDYTGQACDPESLELM